jgi:signal transduction histidine kinase/ligand-binding sensor domain-containing protein/DNA-binding response OmpR family regulator
MKFSKHLLLFLSLQIACSSFAQKPNLNFTHLNTNAGLSQNYVTSIYQDSRGYLWFGTAEEGLNKYDGYRFTVYRGGDKVKNSLSSNQIRDITEDHAGTMWIATWYGLNQFDRATGEFIHYSHNPADPNSISDNFTNALYVDENNNIWIGTEHGGLNFYHRGNRTFTKYLPGEAVKDITRDSDGFIWIATSRSGVFRFNALTHTFTQFKHEPQEPLSLSSSNVSVVFEDSNKNLWIGTRDSGLELFDKVSQTFRHFKKEPNGTGLSSNAVLSIAQDVYGSLWVGLENGGLNILNTNTLEINHHRYESGNVQGLNSHTVNAIIHDAKGNMWLGTYTGGVNFYNVEGNKFVYYASNAPGFGLNNQTIYGITEDKNGNLIIGTDGGGVNIIDRKSGTFSYLTHREGDKNSICGNNVLSVLEDSYRNIWIGTWGEGVTMINKERGLYRHFKSDPLDSTTLSGNNAWTIFEDRNKNIWVGTYWGGLSLYNRERDDFTQFKKGSGNRYGFKSDNVNKICEDVHGNIWIGTFDGLTLYDPRMKRFAHFTHDKNKNSISSDVITSIVPTPSGDLWLGTHNGLNYFDRKANTFHCYTAKDGLINDCIKAMVEDGSGNLWISGNGGISKFNVRTKTFKNYLAADGMPITQFTPNVFKSRSGEIFFSGTNGFIKFLPGKLEEHPFDPPVVFTDFQIFNHSIKVNEKGSPLSKDISETESISLSYKHSVISFEFASLNFTHEQRKQYAYMLEGFDADWNYIGTKRNATYTNLNPGTYTLKVKGLDSEGNWSNRTASVVILISPPYWQTWWFKALSSLVVAVGLIGFYKFRVHEIKRQKRELQELVIERTSDLEKKTEEERAARLEAEKMREEAERMREEADRANSAQRKQEQELIQQKLSFFTEISHEFKTPLTLIIGPLEEMLAAERAVNPAGTKLKLVYRNAQKLLNLINKLLDHRKIENGNVLLKVSHENIVAFVSEIYMNFRELSDHKNIRLNFYPETERIMLWFDKEKLEMVLNNLISNSFKYIGKGNEISIYVRRMTTPSQSEMLEIRIEDNGIGIPEKHVGNIFNWFYTVDTSGTLSSGIGLSIAKKLIDLHHGEILVESAEGQGSVFTIQLPAGNNHFAKDEVINIEAKTQPDDEKIIEQDNGIEGPDHGVIRRGVRTILIVEDDAEIRSFLAELLEKSYRLLQAADGRDALEIAANSRPDMVISDIMMPVMDGIELCKALKTNLETSHIPVILLTAKAGLVNQKHGIETGADAYITKPFSPDILLLTVHNLLQARERLIRHYKNLFAPTSVGSDGGQLISLDEKFLRSVHEVLANNMDKTDFNINEICEGLNMSRSVFYKKIKVLTGVSPLEYVRSLRMQEAAKLLRTKNYKIFEVAYMVGFGEIKYFRQSFIREFGLTPSEFMKQAASGVDSSSSGRR